MSALHPHTFPTGGVHLCICAPLCVFIPVLYACVWCLCVCTPVCALYVCAHLCVPVYVCTCVCSSLYCMYVYVCVCAHLCTCPTKECLFCCQVLSACLVSLCIFYILVWKALAEIGTCVFFHCKYDTNTGCPQCHSGNHKVPLGQLIVPLKAWSLISEILHSLGFLTSP